MILFATSVATAGVIDGISCGTGPKGAAGTRALRLGLAKTWDSEWAIVNSWNLNGYWDLGFYALRRSSKEDVATNNKLLGVSLAPMFRFERVDPLWANQWPYIEVGVGIAQLSKRTIGLRELGTNFQFEDKLGFGLRFGHALQYDLSYKIVHFSNFYLGHKNHGINLHLFSLSYWCN